MRADIHLYLVSAQATPNITPALDPQFRPREAVLLVSPDMGQQAGWLETVLRETGIRVSQVPLEDAWDIEHVRDKVFDWLAERDTEAVALNATGGTKPMCIAAYEVFRTLGKPIFYVHPELDRVIWLFPDKLPAYDLADKVRLKAFFQAHGAQILPHGPHHGVPEPLRRLTEGLLLHADRYARAMRTLNWAAHQAEQAGALRSPEIGGPQLNDDFRSLIEWFEQADLLHFRQGHLFFANEEARFFANGGWLETHVYAECLALKGQELLQDVDRGIVVARETRHGTVRNELDVAFLQANKLFVIECKTKYFGPAEQQSRGADTLYKLDSLRDLVGGLQARAMLASYHDLSDADRRRAEDLRIRLCVGPQLRDLRSLLKQWIGQP